MENLTLPEPAASLWAAKRGIVHAIPPEMFGRSILPHLGGGTLLAARWRHRISTDIETVLSSHQILRGKLECVDQMLVRDVFDVLTAADEEPAALAAAVGMVSKQRAAAIESAWRNAAGMLADNFHDSIRSSRRTTGTGLGPEAAAAFQAHRYTRLEIDLRR